MKIYLHVFSFSFKEVCVCVWGELQKFVQLTTNNCNYKVKVAIKRKSRENFHFKKFQLNKKPPFRIPDPYSYILHLTPAKRSHFDIFATRIFFPYSSPDPFERFNTSHHHHQHLTPTKANTSLGLFVSSVLEVNRVTWR